MTLLRSVANQCCSYQSHQPQFHSQHIVFSKQVGNTEETSYAESVHWHFRDASAWQGGVRDEFMAPVISFSLDAGRNGGNV